MSRSKLNISGDTVRKYAALGLKRTEIAGLLGCDEGTIRKRFKIEYASGRAQHHVALRESQFSKAMAGDPTMLIWLGKQHLGQRNEPLPDDDEVAGEVEFEDASG